MPLQNPANIDASYPDRQYILWGYGKILQGAASFFQGGTTNSAIYYQAYQAPSALNDEIEVTFSLKAGNYLLDILGLRSPNSAIIQIFFNGTKLGGDVDKYAASVSQFNLRFNVPAPSGVQSLRIKVIGKNSASGNFLNQIAAIVVSPQV
jgi:hypothetical protein